MRRVGEGLVLAIVLAALLLSPWQAGLAQSPVDRVVINQVAIAEGAPNVESRVSVLGADGGAVLGLPGEGFTVLEDGAAVSALDVRQEAAGLAILILVDLSGSMKEVGVAQGQDRLQSAVEVLRPFLESTLAPTDWVGITGFHVTTPPEYSTELTQDHGLVRNVLLSLAYDPMGNTALLNTASQALEQLQEQALPGLRKVLFIVSDGKDWLEAQDAVAYEENRQAVAGKAKEYGIPIVTLGIDSYCSVKGQRASCVRSWPENAYESQDVAWLAAQTGGQYIHYGGRDADSQDKAGVEAFLSRLASQGNQYILSYPTHATKGQHQVEVRVTDGAATASAQSTFYAPFELPTVRLTSPADGYSLDLAAGSTIRLEAAVDFADGRPRDVGRVVFYDGVTAIASLTAVPYVFDWDVSGLSGPHTLKVEAYDTVIQDPPATSNPVSVQIVPLPTPTPTAPPVIEILPPTPTSEPWWKTALRLLVRFLPLILAVAAGIVLFIILRRMRRQIAKGVKGAATWVQQRRTQVLGTRPMAAAQVLAKLQKYPADGTEYAVTGRQVSFGSDPALCDVHIPNDPYISGKHFTIIKEGDVFYVVDESSRNGTALNRQDYRLPPGQRVPLAHGSYLYVGNTILQFFAGNVTTRMR